MTSPARTFLSSEDTSDAEWRWQAQHTIRTSKDLESHLDLSAEERCGVQNALAHGMPLAITPYYLSLCDPKDPRCPIRMQCVPTLRESSTIPGDLSDPLGEVAHEVAPFLVQRYPDRALLLVTDRCGVYCRFCTRSRMVGHGEGTLSLKALEPAFAYLKSHPEIQELILSGGDPLIMSTPRIRQLIDSLSDIESLGNVRVASRTPVTLPQRITPELCLALREHPASWLMTHFNHPKELTPESKRACAMLVDHGIPVMNHTVLLRGINDNAATLERLFRGLVQTRVKPYYLLQADPVKGTGHLRTPLSKGLSIMGQLQGRLSGIALPKFIVDTPGGKGKVPLLPNYVHAMAPGRTSLVTFRGEIVDYIDPTEFIQ